MANPHNLELEAAKFLHKLMQESKDEPTKLATKLYVILQHMKSSGKENSIPYQVISRAMETVIKQHGLDIEALMSSRLPLAAGAQVGEPGSSQVAGSSQRSGVTKDPKASLAGIEMSKPDSYASGMSLVGPGNGGHYIYQGSPSNMMGGADKVRGVTPSAAASYLPVETGMSMSTHFAGSSYDSQGSAAKMHKDGMEAFSAGPPLMDLYASENIAGKTLDHEGVVDVLPSANKLNQNNDSAKQNVGAVSANGIGSSQIIGIWQADSSHQAGMVVHLAPSQFFRIRQDISSTHPVEWNSSAVAMTDLTLRGMDTDSAERNIGGGSAPRIRRPQIRGEIQPNSSSEPPQMVVHEKYKRNRVSIQQGDATGSRRNGAVRTLDREYGINRSVLHQYSGKKLEDVADILGVSRSTLKRICRKHHIFRWPPCKAKKLKRNLQESVEAIEGNVEDLGMENQPFSNLHLKLDSASKADTILDAIATLMHDDSIMMVKASYLDDIIKFHLALSSGKIDLEEEVAKRLNLKTGRFSIKYLDEENDWVLVACDADLRTCISTLRSLGKTTIKMKVGDLPASNLTNNSSLAA